MVTLSRIEELPRGQDFVNVFTCGSRQSGLRHDTSPLDRKSIWCLPHYLSVISPITYIH